MDVSERAKTQWHGKWIWSSHFTPRRMIVLGGRSLPTGLSKEDVNTFVLMRHRFTISERLKGAILNITADSRYKVFINGIYIGRGINRCESNYWYYDQYTVLKALKEGENVIAVRARWFGWDTAYYTAPEYPGGSKQKAAKGGVLFDLQLEYENGKEEVIGSGEKTRVIQDPSEKQDMPLRNGCLGFIEELDTSKLPKMWNEVGFDDSTWEEAFLLDYPITTLLRDENNPRDEKFYYPKKILNIGECDDCIQDLDEEDLAEMDFNIFHKIEYPPSEITSFEIKNGEGIKREGEIMEIVPKEGSENKVFAMFVQFEKEMVGYPQLIVEGGEGTIIDIIPSEKKYDNFNPGIDCFSNKRGVRFILRGDKQFLEAWTWEGYLYMLVKIRNISEPLKIYKLGTNFTHMRVVKKGKFVCDNEQLNDLWEVCAHTLLCCAIDGYLDCPSREQRSYLGDAYPEALIANACFGEPRLTKKLI